MNAPEKLPASAEPHVMKTYGRLPVALSSHQPLIDRLMAKDPAQRFQNADEVVTFLMQ